MKRFFTLTLMLFCFILHGFAFEFNYTDENGVTWTCWTENDDETSTVELLSASNYGAEVVVPEKVYDGETAHTVNLLNFTFKDSEVITKVILPKIPIGISTAFNNCHNLTEVVNSQYITKCDEAAFNHTSLTSIDLTNCKYVSGFSGCNKLKTATLKVCETIGFCAFTDCTNLVSLGETANVRSIGTNAFYGCESLTALDLSNCDTLENYIFYDCNSLKDIKLSKALTIIPDYQFKGCPKITNINISNVTSIGREAFKNCSNITKVDLTNVKTIGVSAFEGTGLKEINLPVAKKIESDAFRYCNNLTKVELANVDTIGTSAFEGTGLKEITLPTTITSIGNNAFNDIDNVTINATKVPSLDSFFGQNTVVFVPEEAVNTYKAADVWKDFAGQIFAIGTKTDYDVKTTAQDNAPGLLQQLDRNNLNNIVSLKVSGTINGYDIMLFRNKMDNLHHLDLSDADIVANPYEYYQGMCTQDSILGGYAFSELDKLITVKCPKSVKQIYGAFNSCHNLKSVVLPEHLEYLYDSFADCNHLTNVIFYDCKEIRYNTFYGCSAIQQINIPEGVTRIGGSAFSGCKSLKSIIIPNGVETIENYAFYDCI